MSAVIKKENTVDTHNEQVIGMAKEAYDEEMSMVAFFNAAGLSLEDQQDYVEAKNKFAPNAPNEAFARLLVMDRINVILGR